MQEMRQGYFRRTRSEVFRIGQFRDVRSFEDIANSIFRKLPNGEFTFSLNVESDFHFA